MRVRVATIVPVYRITHVHVERDSRDCDSRYEDGRIFRLADNDPDNVWTWYVGHILEFLDPVAESIVRDVTGDGYPRLVRHRQTEEGYEHEEVVGCDDPTCDPRVRRYRDHTAESMGY